MLADGVSGAHESDEISTTQTRVEPALCSFVLGFVLRPRGALKTHVDLRNCSRRVHCVFAPCCVSKASSNSGRQRKFVCRSRATAIGKSTRPRNAARSSTPMVPITRRFAADPAAAPRRSSIRTRSARRDSARAIAALFTRAERTTERCSAESPRLRPQDGMSEIHRRTSSGVRECRSWSRTTSGSATRPNSRGKTSIAPISA